MTDALPRAGIPLDKPAYSILEVCEVLEIGRNSGYGAARQNLIPTITIGRTKRVPGNWLREQLRLSATGAPTLVAPTERAEPERVTSDDEAERRAAFAAWCERTAQRLLKLPKLDKALRARIERHMTTHDWIARDGVELNALLKKYADALAKL
jgi:hypothetical protein